MQQDLYYEQQPRQLSGTGAILAWGHRQVKGLDVIYPESSLRTPLTSVDNLTLRSRLSAVLYLHQMPEQAKSSGQGLR